VIAGLFSLFGALVYAELGAMMPETGGIYVYFRRMFGDFVAFLYGWAAFSVINTAATAAISFVCAQYMDYFLHLPRFTEAVEKSFILPLPFIGDLYPLQNFGVKILAAVLIALLTWINVRSVKAGSTFQLVTTIVKIVLIVLLVGGIFFSGQGSFSNFYTAADPKSGSDLLAGIIAALTGAFFAYDGWINVTFIAGEIKQPQKNIPASLWLGVLVCIVVYLLVNQAYLYVLPVESIAGSQLVAADAIAVALGTTGSTIVAAMIVICTLGAINGNAMSTARVTFAMGRDKIFLPWTGKVHNRYQTPVNALWLHAAWTIGFIITGSFDMLADMFVFITWIAYGLGAIGIFMLRRKMPLADRPYRIWGHPFVTLVFIAFAFCFLVITVYNDITNYQHGRQPVVNSMLGILITALGIPLYYYYRKRKRN
jgi:APA family basic amino acid/polyamine antiporter